MLRIYDSGHRETKFLSKRFGVNIEERSENEQTYRGRTSDRQ